MAKVNALIHAFNTGEQSFAGMSRVDQQRTRLAAEIQENFLPAVVGRAQFRPGLEYVVETVNSAYTRLMPFVRAVDDWAILMFSRNRLRFLVDGAVLSIPAVTATVTNGAFSSATGWTLIETGSASATVSGGSLKLSCPYRGGEAVARQTITINEDGIEHVLRIVVSRGPVRFRAGSSLGADDYVRDTLLGKGEHHLSFYPTGSAYIKFSSKIEREIHVDSCEIEASGTVSFAGLPWETEELNDIQFTQSVDVLFLAHANWQQRKIERRGRRSWSVVYYEANDGPFLLSKTADVTLEPTLTRGNTQLTASSDFFTEDHVGCLFQLTHDNFIGKFGLAGEDTYTDAFQVRGVGGDNNFNWTVSGTWTGTLRVFRSFTDYDVGYVRSNVSPSTDEETTGNGDGVTGNGTFSFQSGEEFNNLTHYFRIGFEGSDYTSGAVEVRINYRGHSGSGICRVTSIVSSTVANIEVIEDFKCAEPTSDWLEGAWSGRSGYPAAVALYDNRLFWGGEDQIWGSEANDYYAFNLETEGAAGSIQRYVATGGAVQRIRWMMPLQRLIIGTDSAEVSVRSSSFDEPLTPTAITLRDASTQGVASIAPVKLDTRGIYIQRSKKRVYEIVYNFEVNDYVSKEITDLNENIGGDGEIEQLSIQRQPEPYIWHVRDDGQCPVLIYEPSQEVAGYVRVVTDGVIEQCVTLPGTEQDIVYFVVRREINGATVRYVERMAQIDEARGGQINKMLDSFKYYHSAVQAITDLSHLEGETVRAWGNSKYLGEYTVTSGAITLSEEATRVCVGLPYTGKYKSAKLAYGAQAGTAIAQKKHIKHVGLVMENVHPDGFTYGTSFDEMFPLPDILPSTQQAIGTSTLATFEEMMMPAGISEWSVDERFCIQVEAPYACSLLNLVLNVETNETV